MLERGYIVQGEGKRRSARILSLRFLQRVQSSRKGGMMRSPGKGKAGDIRIPREKNDILLLFQTTSGRVKKERFRRALKFGEMYKRKLSDGIALISPTTGREKKPVNLGARSKIIPSPSSRERGEALPMSSYRETSHDIREEGGKNYGKRLVFSVRKGGTTRGGVIKGGKGGHSKDFSTLINKGAILRDRAAKKLLSEGGTPLL